ncbi:type III secretion system inner membrane ring lipoprotein SctJ [Comamonas sp. NLF-1-9]|uniref:type III secretion system inner membrane ring lipoprotein SctJ n=1 Tax=Comamonas sp. NLF-1-9 TaxID=2853163 RepID=UPI001C46AF8A|nr:type III secretion inner membrane ring lipoprotein SctJ [Comamonas sp. NLF-1-9]QXL83624.1 type III secretion inner membrane ring lipoprotein SctJ [Comamonas sp. NLF-1-9]
MSFLRAPSFWRRALHGLVLSLSLLLLACGGRVDLMGAVPEDEANEVLAVLLKAEVNAVKTPGKDGLVGVQVSSQQVGQALQVLRDNGLPRERYAGMGQVFKKEGLISSPLEERARYVYALSQELSGTLSKIDGVLYARVHVVLPERGVAGEPGVPSTAAVFIKHQEGRDLELLQPQIRRLVTNSIPGLSPERVSIVFVSAPAAEEAAASPPLAQVLGIGVSADAAARLQALLWGLVVVLLLALGAAGWLAWRFALPVWKGGKKPAGGMPAAQGAQHGPA